MQLEFKGTTPRHPLWSKEQFLKDLEKYKVIKHVCSIYALEGQTWFTYYADVWRWRKSDPDFNMSVKELTNLPEGNTGRPPLNGDDKSWIQDFCEALYKYNGNKAKAAKESPYSLRQIHEMMDINASSYNEEFMKSVNDVYHRIASEFEETFLSLRQEQNYRTFDGAKIAQTKGWIAIKALENLDPARWGRKSQVNVSGTIDHRHKLERTKTREEILLELWEDRQNFIEARKKQIALQAGDESVAIELPKQESKEEVIEAEIISDDGKSRAI